MPHGSSLLLLCEWVSCVCFCPFWSCWFVTSYLYDVLVFYKSYKDALEAYQGAAESSTPQVPDEQQQQRQQQVQQTAGKAIKQFLKDLWSSFVIINALLIASSITPFSQAASQAAAARYPIAAQGAMMPNETTCSSNLCYYDHRVFGSLWAGTLGFNCLALTISMLLMGFLLAVPDEGVVFWATEQLKYRRLGLPATATLLGTAAFVSSIVYTTGVFYDWPAFMAILIIFSCAIATGLAGMLQFRYKPHKQRPPALPLWTAQARTVATAVNGAAPHTAPSVPDMVADVSDAEPSGGSNRHCCSVSTTMTGAQQSRTPRLVGDTTHARHLHPACAHCPR